MKLDLFLDKGVEKNAEVYFNKAKKLKSKLEGAEEALKKSEEKLDKLKEEKEKVIEEIEREAKEKEEKKRVKKEWYEKFHWFFSSEGFLCIGGRDATSNEIVVKKQVEKNDLIVHADVSGSPFFVIKKGQEAGDKTVKECGIATASYSKAWRLGLGRVEVFSVKPEQVTKEAKSGEYMAKGSFMVYGERNNFEVELKMAVGVKDGKVIGGPLSAIKEQTDDFMVVFPGKNKKSDTAKKIKKKIGGDLDEIIAFLPAGGSRIEENFK